MSHKSGVWKFFTGSSRAHCTLCTSCSRGKERGSTEYKYSLILVTSTGKKEVPNWCVCFSNHCNMHGKFHELKTLVKQACRRCFYAVKDKSSAVLVSEILRLILPGTRVISDALRSYRPLSQMGIPARLRCAQRKLCAPGRTTEQSTHRTWKSGTDDRRTPFGVTEATDDYIRTVLRTLDHAT